MKDPITDVDQNTATPAAQKVDAAAYTGGVAAQPLTAVEETVITSAGPISRALRSETLTIILLVFKRSLVNQFLTKCLSTRKIALARVSTVMTLSSPLLHLFLAFVVPAMPRLVRGSSQLSLPKPLKQPQVNPGICITLLFVRKFELKFFVNITYGTDLYLCVYIYMLWCRTKV